MFAQFRLTRLLVAGLAACAVTWALAAGAIAMPLESPQSAAADTNEPQAGTRPEYKVVPGDVKEPQAASRPEYTPAINDDKSDADRARAVPPPVPSTPVSIPAAPDDDTSTVALILSIAAILTALGAVTLTVTRPPRGTVRA
jgi:hypothetical protein